MTDDLKGALAHVLWMGGSPCSGKSSIAERLVARYGLRHYQCDVHFNAHQERATPQAHPAFYRLRSMTWEAIWMRPVDVLIADELAIYGEEFGMIVEDLLALPDDRPILAEGAALLPACVIPLLARRQQAIYVVPTPAFQWEHYSRRGFIHEILSQCSDPDRAFRNWMERDVGFGQQIAAEAQAAGLGLLMVDGGRSIEENTALVAGHYALDGADA